MITLGAAVLAMSIAGPGAARADDGPAYRVTLLGSLGGAPSRSNSINDHGLVSGYSTLPDGTRHAVAWTGTTAHDLGTLGGANSSVAWPVKNEWGLVAGISQTSTTDPLHEPWSCAAFIPYTGQECRGFASDGHRRWALPTLGGNNGFAAGANNLGQITGWAETPVHDPTCVDGQVLQFLPVVYGPRPGSIRALPLLPGDTSGAATAINDRSQAVGISGLCDQAVGRLTARHAVLWSHGTVHDLGTLGADWWNTPMAINKHGDVVGFAGDPSDISGTVTHAFIWTGHGSMRPLIPGDVNSTAAGINDRGDVVGTTCDATGASCHGFLWQHGRLTILDEAARATGFTGDIVAATDINDRGVITGRATVDGVGYAIRIDSSM
jgi:probable HAF family extracellular repeat protein